MLCSSKLTYLGRPRVDRATNHINRVLQQGATHVLLAYNYAAFLARIMEDCFLSLQGPKTRLADDRFRDVFRATLLCDRSRDYGLSSNNFP